MSASDVAAKFREIFDRDPEVISQAPGRVNLIGEHVDYNDGFVLPFAINAVTYSAIARRKDGVLRIASQQRRQEIIQLPIADLKSKSGDGWARYILGTVWSLGIETGLEIYVDGQVPLGSGLSSSAALECSVATSINHLFNLGKSKTDLAYATQRAENEYVGVPCGIMDQSISLMGRTGYALLLDCRDLSTQQIPVDFAGAGLRLLIIDTRAHHALVDGGYAERRASCEKVARQLGVKALRDLRPDQLEEYRSKLDPLSYKRARHVVTEIQRVHDSVSALTSGDFAGFGEILNSSHQSLRDDYNVSCAELDCAVETSIKEGALGARMVGGGFGGSAIALIHEADAGRISLAIERAFANSGFTPPQFFDSLPSDGAKVIS